MPTHHTEITVLTAEQKLLLVVALQGMALRLLMNVSDESGIDVSLTRQAMSADALADAIKASTDVRLFTDIAHEVPPWAQ